MRIRNSALRHGITVEDIEHAWEFAVGDLPFDPSHDPPKRLRLGPDHAGNLLELVYLEDDRTDGTIIHAMRLRTSLNHYLRRM